MGKSGGLGIYDQFPGYEIFDEAEREEALKDALVVVDANVLLSLYRYNQQTRSDLLKVLHELGDRLWAPHQAVREFWRNRASVVTDRSAATSTTVASLGRQTRAATDAIRNWQRATAVDQVTADDLVAKIEEAYEHATTVVQNEDPARRESFKVTTVDPVLRELENLLSGHVGRAMDEKSWALAVTEGKRRAAIKLPPGYRDADKADGDLPEGPAGDYLVWRQLLDEARTRGKTTFLVTNDEKEDWWQKYRNERLGPRQELVVEFVEEVGQRFHMVTTADLLRAADALHVEVENASIEDAERVERSGPTDSEWTDEGTIALMDGLYAEDAHQFEVLYRAALNGGVVMRSEVYEVCNFPPGRSLRGITKPVKRITSRLQKQGVVGTGVQPALRAIYKGTAEADSFRVPQEMLAHILDNYSEGDADE